MTTNRCLVFGALLLSTLNPQLSSSAAALRTWDGGGTNNFWATAANWAGDVAPSAGDDLLFPSGAARLSNSNNLPSGTAFNSLTFSAGGYTLRGETISLSSGVTNLSGVNSVYLPLLLSASQTFSSANYLQFLAGIELAGQTLTLDTPAELILSGPVTGAGAILKTGSGGASVFGNSSFVGSVQVLQGSLIVGHSNALGLAASGTAVAPGATILLSGAITVGEPLALAGTLINSSSATSAWSGPITITNAAKIQTGGGYPLTLSGIISGTGSLSKTTVGTLRLTANNSYTGPTTNLGGTLIVNGSQPSSDIYTAGTFGGTGTVGSFFPLVSGVSLLPGEPSPGRLTTGNLTLGTGTSFGAILNSLAPGTGYTQLRVLGTVNLVGSPSLGGALGFLPALGASFVIIDNDGADPVVGTFRLLPEGALMGADSAAFQITYKGGTGNDVVLTRVAVPPLRFASITPLANGTLQLQATGVLDSVYYQIETATSLVPVIQWSNIGGKYANAGVFTFTDTDAPLFPARFYRAISP